MLAVYHPEIVSLLTEGERRVLFGLKENHVLAIGNWVGASYLVQLFGGCGGLYPCETGDENTNESNMLMVEAAGIEPASA